MRVLHVIFMTSVLGCGSAAAADLILAPVAPMAPMLSTYDWTGFYIGGKAGVISTIGDPNYNNTGFPGFHGDLDATSLFGGLYAGANFQVGSGFVLGIDGDVNYSGQTVASPLLNGAGVPVAGQSFNAELLWFGSGRLRAGYAFDRFLPYVTGGFAFADYNVTNTVGAVTEAANSAMRVGWTVGGGFEYAATDEWIVRAEYRYSDYGSVNSGSVVFDDYDIGLTTHDVSVGLAYKF